MSRATFVKDRGFIRPADEETERIVARIKEGDGFAVEIKFARNVRFHRRLFALLQLVFESWEPHVDEEERIAPAKNFDGFREQVLILAGHAEQVFNLDGTFRMKAKSLAFDKLDDLGFEHVYKAVLSVVWNHVMSKLRYGSEAELDSIVNRILGFD